MKNTHSKPGALGARIRAAREDADMSQAEFAKALGFQSATAISLIENGERGVSTTLLTKLANLLHRDVNYFLGGVSKSPDILVALRADRDLSKDDKAAILRFVELAKKKNAR